MSPLPQRPPIVDNSKKGSNESAPKLSSKPVVAPFVPKDTGAPTVKGKLPVEPVDVSVKSSKLSSKPVTPPVTSPQPATAAPAVEPVFVMTKNGGDSGPAFAYEEPTDTFTDDDESNNFNVEEAEEFKREQLINSLSDNAKQSARLLLERISDDECSEVLMNGPQSIIVKINGNRLLLNDIKFENVEEYHTVINTLILHDTETKERIGESDFLIETQLELPDYDNPEEPSMFARVHVMVPYGKAATVTIAKKAKRSFHIDDFVAKGTMTMQMAQFLKALARGKASIVFSGVGGSGKTTLLEAMSYEFDENDRVIVIEDTPELSLPIYDVVYLLATSRKPNQKETEIVSMEWLVAQANRMRADRIIVGESRGGEFAEFLNAANSGADGSMTTIHAQTPRRALTRMASMAMKSSVFKSENSLNRDIASTIQIIVQLARIDGKHVVTTIEEVSSVVSQQTNTISTQPLFNYDRMNQRFMVTGQPTEQLTQFLASRGVSIERSWFVR